MKKNTPKKIKNIFKCTSPTKKLRASGLKATPTRIAILECLGKSHSLYSIDELVTHLNKKSQRTFDWSTVYRCIMKLEQEGIVQASMIRSGSPKYELHDPNHHHHHIVCNKCSEIKSIDACSAKSIEKMVKRMGYTDISHRLEIFAVCANCQ